jgi:hypothetical protein
MRPAQGLSFASLALAAALVHVATPARADSVVPPPAPKFDLAKAEAQRLAEMIKRGKEMCAAGDVDQGLPALRAAWTQRQDVELAVALGACEIKASEWASAAEHLAYAIRSTDVPETKKSLEATFANVRARVGAVTVTVTIDGADVFAGNRFVGQSPLPGEVFVSPGPARISAKRTGYGEVEGQVDLKPGGSAALKLDLAGEGTVAQSQKVTRHRSVAPAYVLGAIGAVAAGFGAAYEAAAFAKGSAGDDLLGALIRDYPAQGSNPCYGSTHTACTTLSNLRQSHDTFSNVGTGLLAGGGALIGVGVIYGLWATFSEPPSERRAQIRRDRITVDVGAAPFAKGSAGLSIHGTF